MLYTFKASPWGSHAKLLEFFPPEGHGRRVLDVGCGDGYLGALLAARGYRVTGIERAGGFSDRFPASVELVPADLEAGLPSLPHRYDYVLCADILEHLREPSALLHQTRAVLTSGGVVIASLPNSGNIWFRGNILFGRFPQDDRGLFDRTHVRFYMWGGWLHLFHEAGLRVTRTEPTAIPIGLIAPPRWEHSFTVRTAERVCYGLARIWKTLFAYQFVVRAEPSGNE